LKGDVCALVRPGGGSVDFHIRIEDDDIVGGGHSTQLRPGGIYIHGSIAGEGFVGILRGDRTKGKGGIAIFIGGNVPFLGLASQVICVC
jgi:hypothetical protein